jgi:uncharacterized protein (TIGR02117 family)
MRFGDQHTLPVRAAGFKPRRHSFRRFACLIALPLTLAACAGGAPPVAGLPPGGGPAGTVALVTHGWHTDIAVPADEVTGPLTRFRTLFPGARMLVFGYGKRTFMIAPAHTLGEWIIGPFPGPAAVEVSAISSDAATAYGAEHVETLTLPPGGAARLSAFLWQALSKDDAGNPAYIAQGNWPGSLFYEASTTYGLLHTCNSWSAQALAASGLPITPAGVVFSSTLDAQVRHLSSPAG